MRFATAAQPDLLAALAALLEYPGADFDRRLAAAVGTTRAGYQAPSASGAGESAIPEEQPLARFAAAMAALPRGVREELHAATFEITPACVPYLSIHLFGEENYQRGVFMAALRQRYQETQFEAGDELPDHLAVVLRYAAVAGPEEARELSEYCLLTPVSRLISGLSTANPYRDLLAAIAAALESRFPGVSGAPLPVEQMRHHGDATCSGAHDRACSGGRCASSGPFADRPDPRGD